MQINEEELKEIKKLNEHNDKMLQINNVTANFGALNI